jgi:hypothetical protein
LSWPSALFGSFLLIVFVSLAGCTNHEEIREAEPVDLPLEYSGYLGVNDMSDTFLITGTVRNTGSIPIRSIEARVDYLATNRTLVASHHYRDDGILMPGESKEFEYLLNDPVVPHIHYYYITPKNVEYVI